MIKLQDKFKLRLKVLEEAVRAGASSNGVGAQRRPSRTNGFSRRGQLICGVDSARTLPSNGSGFELEIKSSVSTEATRKYSASSVNSLAEKETQDIADVDATNGSSDRTNLTTNGYEELKTGDHAGVSTNTNIDQLDDSAVENCGNKLCTEIVERNAGSDDTVSGVFYDMLQREVITLRKACHDKDLTVKEKEDAIQVS